MKAWKITLALGLLLTAVAAFAVERFPVYVDRGASYALLYDGGGNYLFGIGSANPDVRSGFGTSGHTIPDGALFFRTDLGTFYTPSAGVFGAATLAGQTLTSTTLTAPTITTPTVTSPVVTGNAGTGFPIIKRCTLTEDATNTTYTCTIPVPAGAVIEDIQVIPRVLWNGTSASLVVGDTDDPNGYFLAINLKATDAVIGEMFSVKHGDLWGGEEGAYLVAATGRRGPTTSNFSMSYVAGSDITFVVTEGAADGTTGRTDCVVIYSTPETIAQVAAS